jgi:putative oxidoreductase
MQNTLLKDVGLAILRIAPSAMILSHGIPKLQKIISGNLEFGDPLGIGSAPSLFLAVIGEVLCPLFIIIGLKTRWMAVPSAITMAVAAFVVHAADDFATKERALLYLVFFIAIILLGPGKYSFDRR